MGILKAGRVYVPIEPRYPLIRNRLIFRDAEPSLVLTDTLNLSTAKSLGSGTRRIINLDKEASLRMSHCPDASVAAEDLSCPIYTSGSTGKPKGVVHTHQTMLHNGHRRRLVQGITPNDRVTLLYSSSVIGGAQGMFTTLMAGASLHPNEFSKVSTRRLIQWIRKEKITVYHSVATVFREVVSQLEPGEAFHHVRLVIFGGERAFSSDLENVWKWFPEHCEVFAGLGTTETGSVRGWRLNRATEFPGEVIPSGYPIPGVEVVVITSENQVAKPGEPGEIVVTSPYLFKGYWRESVNSSATVPNDPEIPHYRTYRTGDRGVILPDGKLVLGARTDSQVSIRGFRVELGEIESVLLKHPKVANAAVTIRNPCSSDPGLSAYAVAIKTIQLSIRELRDYLQERLPGHMVPIRYAILDKLPTTQNGKTDRKRLEFIEDFRISDSEQYVPPRDELEVNLADVFGTELKCEPMGIHISFFDAGLSSILAVRCITRVETELGLRLPLNTLFDAPTVALLAARIRCRAAQDSWSSVVVINPGGSRPPLICLPGVGGIDSFRFRKLAKRVGEDQPFYAVQLQGLEGEGTVYRTVEEIAAARINLLTELKIDEPYYLLGYSFGGRLVYEMAHQLHLRGHQVAFVGLIDSWAPGFPRIEPWISRYRSHRAHLAQLIPSKQARYLGRQLRSAARKIQRTIKDFHCPRPGRARSLEERLVETEKAAKQASRRYEPPVYSGDVVLFRATTRPNKIDLSFEDQTNGWSVYAQRSLQVYDIPSTHTDIMGEPDVAELGKALRHSLDETAKTTISPPID